MDPQTQFCPNMACPARGQRGEHNIVTSASSVHRIHSRKESRYQCKVCGQNFAASMGTPFYRLRHSVEEVTRVVTLRAYGCPIQAIPSAENNQVILSSETYTSKSGAANGIASVRTNAPMEARYQRLTAADGRFYFNLRAANHQVIGTSEMYTPERARDNGIQAVQRVGPGPADQRSDLSSVGSVDIR